MSQWDQAAQGAAGGAMAGSMFGPWGTAIGGLVGGAAGYFGGQGASDYQDQLKQLAAGYANRQAPQMGSAFQAGNSKLLQNRAGLITQLEAMARGEGPSAATQQMREAMDRAAGAQASAAAGAGGRGVNAGAALRNASNMTAATQMQGARDTGIMRSQEQMGAINQLGGVIGQGIGQDNQQSQFNANQQQAVGLANLQAKLQTMGLDDESQLKALMAAMGVAGPGTGTSILAGGASALPSILQHQQGQSQQQMYMDALAQKQQINFGQYQTDWGKDPNAQSGPITSPNQV